MRIIVLVKEVPDMDRVRFDGGRGVVDRASAEAEANPFDLSALQAAVELRDGVLRQGGNSSVTALCMGPPGAERTLRDIYARGADRCVLLTDRKFAGADTLATARTLAAGIRRLGGFDLILCGEKTVDGDTAQVGAAVAGLLEIPHCCCAVRVEAGDGCASAIVRNLCGMSQRRRMRLPALASVAKGIAAPRLPTVARKLESLDIPLETLGLNELSGYLSQEEAGALGSPTRVVKVESPDPVFRDCKLFAEDYDGFFNTFIGFAAQFL